MNSYIDSEEYHEAFGENTVPFCFTEGIRLNRVKKLSPLPIAFNSGAVRLAAIAPIFRETAPASSRPYLPISRLQ